MKTILFVCTGNICRSPMAEGLFRHAIKGRYDYRVLSAGVGAIDGQPPSTYSVQAMKEIGVTDRVQSDAGWEMLDGVKFDPKGDLEGYAKGFPVKSLKG